MREILLYGLAILIGVAGAFISVGLPTVVWLRRRKAAAALYDEFMTAKVDAIRFGYNRIKKPFGEGFLDSYEGDAGSISFRFEIELVPFRKLHVYRFRLERRVDGEPLVHELRSQADPTGPDPLAILAKTLRRAHARREKVAILEAD